jgi:polar amino acid transport system substrate-binding protein
MRPRPNLNIRILCLSVAFVVWQLWSLASAEDNPPAKTLTCYSTTFEPYVFEQDGKVVGVDADAVREIGRRLGIHIEIALKPWVRLERDIKLGTEDCAFAYFRTADRLDYMHFTNVPLHITSYTLFVLEENQRTFSSMADISGFVVGINQGFKTTPEFEAAVKQNVVTEYRVREEAMSFQMLNAKRVNAVLTNEYVGAYQIKQLELDGIVPLFPPLSSTPAYLTFAKKDELKPWVEKFDSALFQILTDGTYQAIFDRYTKNVVAP